VNVTAYNCTICETAVPGSTFWGFVSAIINFNSLVNGTDSRLKELVTLGYNYEMKAQQPAGGTLMIAKYGPAPSDPVTATVHIPNGDWTLYVQPQAGWVPSWRDPMLAAVVVVGCLLGLLLTAILAGQHMQRLLLRETQVSGCCGVRRSQAKGVCRMLQLLYTPMLQVLSQMSPPWHGCFCCQSLNSFAMIPVQVANSQLAAEKQRMDVLLARQYNLITCVLDNHGGGVLGKQSMEEQTLGELLAVPLVLYMFPHRRHSQHVQGKVAGERTAMAAKEPHAVA
jgi:hypothetical protein